MNIYSDAWNKSYTNRDNFIFYPQEDIVRFISKYIRKRVGLDEFLDQNNYVEIPRILDIGCGIGRHIKLLEEFHLDGYGFDLSHEAIKVAKSNFIKQEHSALADKVIVSDITNLPYKDKFFDFMLSHGVLDSMPFKVSKKGMKELSRVLKKGGLVYIDLISTDDSSFEKTDSFERVVEDEHEKGTMQTYFNIDKINELIEPEFEILEMYNIKKIDELKTQQIISRHHVVVRKK